MLYLTIIIACGLFSIIQSAPSAGNRRLQMRILRHQPCTAKPTASERIRFSSMSKAPLVNDEQHGDGCYTIQGPVTVRKAIQGTVQIVVEAKSGTKAPIEKFTGADSHNCGGFGSCVYCDICSSMKEIERSTSGFVHVEMGNGKQFDCENGLSAGNYTDIRMNFCMPTKNEFLEAEGIGEDVWKANGEGGHTFMMTMYIFNKAVNKLSQSELSKITTDNSDQVIGCHKLIGSVSEGSD